MARQPTKAIDDRIVALHGAHKTRVEISSALAREGIQITPSGVHRALGRLGLATPRKGVAPPVAKTGVAPGPVSPPAGATVEDDPTARLLRALASLERCAAQAEADRDVARVVAAQRAITQAAGLLSKLTPPPPVDVNAQPDMRAAAERGAERMHTILDRLLGAAK